MSDERGRSVPSPTTIRFVGIVAAGLTMALAIAVIRNPLRGEASPRDWRIDVNRASAEELAAIPGLGPALAAKIVQDRADHGIFDSVDDLDRVNGIGLATVEMLRPWMVAEDPQAALHPVPTSSGD